LRGTRTLLAILIDVGKGQKGSTGGDERHGVVTELELLLASEKVIEGRGWVGTKPTIKNHGGSSRQPRNDH